MTDTFEYLLRPKNSLFTSAISSVEFRFYIDRVRSQSIVSTDYRYEITSQDLNFLSKDKMESNSGH